MATQSIQLGDRTIEIAQLKLGQLKGCSAELAAIVSMRKAPEGAMPTAAQLDAMAGVVFASAVAADPTLTRDVFSALLDDQAYDVGIQQLSDAVAIVMQRSGLAKPTGTTKEGSVPGEAPSPMASTSSGSTE